MPCGATHASTRTLLLDACKVGRAVVAVGERGNVIRSEDSGVSWEHVGTPMAATLTGVSFADTVRGWAVGHHGAIMYTDDGGFTWAIQNNGVSEEAAFLDVLALNARQAIAVGGFGVCYITQDGRTWTARKLGDEELHLNRVVKGPSGEILVTGERGAFFRLKDVRAEPEVLNTGYEGTLNGVLVGTNGWFAYGLRGHVFRAENASGAWQPVAGLPPVLISCAVELEAGPIILAGQARALLISYDAGATFSPLRTGITTAVAEIVEAPDGSLLTFGEDGVNRVAISLKPEGAKEP